jgi:hypothetical protein
MSAITETKEANQLGSMVEMELMTAGDLELESEGGMAGNEAESCNSNAMQRSNFLVSDGWIQNGLMEIQQTVSVEMKMILQEVGH